MTHSTPQPVGDRLKHGLSFSDIESIAHNLCSLHDFDPAFVRGQERFAMAIIEEYRKVATTPATREDGASGADGEREVQYEVWQDGMMVAASTDPADAKHYLAVYGQDGPVVGRTAVTTRYDGFDARPLSPDQPSARERRLEEALRPFATVGALIDRYFIDRPDDGVFQSGAGWNDAEGKSRTLTLGDFRRARQALAHNQEGGR